jgi:hypothetical protein
LLFFALGGLLALWFPFVLRNYFIEQAVRDSLLVLREISASLPQSGSGVEAEDLLFPLWPGEVDEVPELTEQPEPDAALAPVGRAKRRSVAPYRPVVGPPPQSARASQTLVLKWAEAGVMPSGVLRTQSGDIPAGIELRGVAGLGVGLLDGDRLVRVNGVPVQSRGHVVGAVLGARSRGEASVVASLVRMTASGAESFTVTVEQPYLPPTPEPQPPAEVTPAQ